MVRKNLMVRDELYSLAGMPEQKDLYISEKLKIDPERIKGARKYKKLIDNLHAAADLIIEASHTIVPVGDISAQLTDSNLAAIVDSSWKNPESAKKLASKHIINYVRSHLEMPESRLHIPLIHVYRDHLGVYTGNLIEAAEIYPGFKAADSDFLCSYIIPVEQDLNLGIFLGFLAADGYLAGNGHTRYYNFAGSAIPSKNHPNFRLYEGLSDRIRSLFNSFNTPEVENRPPSYNEATDVIHRSSKRPIIGLASTAIVSWLRHDMSFENMRRKRKKGSTIKGAPYFANDQVKTGFLAGTIAAKGKLGIYGSPPRPRFNIHSRDHVYLDIIRDTAQELGYKRGGNFPTRVQISEDKLFADMLIQGLFIHEKHEIKMRNFYR
ncbi:MAG: hypothetical protein K9N07_10980 [Candidatus Cloacimonetes bacterium]|nr:hypothetical protein [Candidatus Cloacimonadota bacterium]